MAKSLIFILTEGDHDSAFIYRILKANGAVTDNRIIKDYPFPLNEMFTNGVSNISLEDLNIQEAGSRFLPYRVMNYKENIILLYTIGGDTQSDKRIHLVKVIDLFSVKDPDAIQATTVDMSVLYFYDADDKGIDERMIQVQKELAEAFPSNQVPSVLNNTEVYAISDMKIGAFVFAEPGKETGMLEDVLIPLMQAENDDIFDAAENFLNIHESTILFKGKLKMDGKTIKKVNGQKYNYRKSLIGTVGQLQKSGKANTVCISDADYLNTAKILKDTTCISIEEFIRKVVH